MKKIMNLFVLVAAAVTALASCQKNEIENPVSEQYQYIFLIGNADESEADSKATLGENSVEWTTGDQIGTFAGSSNNKYSEVTVTDGTASFSVYSQNGLSVGEILYFYYPRVEGSSMQKTAVTMSVPTDQDGKDDMPMVSLPFTVTEESTSNNTDYAGEIRFANLGAVIEFKVYTETPEYASEIVKSVSFVSDQKIAGGFEFDLTKVDYSDKTTLEIPELSENTVLVSAADAVVGKKDTPLLVRMVVAPGEYTGSVIVRTNAATYTFPMTTARNFPRSAVYPLGLRLRADVREEQAPDVWTLVTSVDNMPDGEYVILAKHVDASGYGYLPSTTSTSDAPAYVPQTIFDAFTSVVVPTSVDKAMIWNFAQTSGKWTITSPDEKYFYCISNNNGLRVGTTEDTWTISVNAYNSSAFTMKSNNNSRFVGVYNNADWRSYNSATAGNYGTAANGYQNAQLFFYYRGTITAKPGVSAADVTGIPARSSEQTLTYTLVNPDGSSVSVECDGTVVTAAEKTEEGTITYTVSDNNTAEAREGSITIRYGEVEKVVKVSQLAPKFSSSEEEILLEAEAGASASFTVTSDFGWTAELPADAAFSIDPASYDWAEGGEQSVTVTANAAREEEGIADLGTVTFTNIVTGQTLEVAVKQESSYVAEGAGEETLTFSAKYSANTVLTGTTVSATNFTVKFDNNGGTAPQYYTNGTAVRAYAKNTFTVSSDKTITKIELIFGADDKSNEITANLGTYSSGTWTGSASSVVFTVGGSSGNRRIAGIKVYYVASTSGGESGGESGGGETTDPDPTPSGNTYTKYTGNLVEGDYIIVYDACAMNTTVSNDRLQCTEVTPANDVISDPADNIIWHIAKSGDYWTIYNASANKYAASTGAKNKAQMLASGTDDKSLWTISGSGTYEFVNKNNKANSVNSNLRRNGTYGFACYATSTGGALTLYKKN